MIGLFRGKPRKFWVLNLIVSFAFGAMWISGADLDQNGKVEIGVYKLVLMIGMALLILPVLCWVTDKADHKDIAFSSKLEDKKLRCLFAAVALCWLLGYLAMFPGVYTTDSPFWYYEFANSDVPISSSFSLIYTGLFYLFVESGKNLLGSWDYGFAVFTFLQMSFILFAVFRILEFFNRYLGRLSTLICAAFFALIPTHVILSVSSAQDGPFMACFSMCILHLIQLVLNKETYLGPTEKPGNLAERRGNGKGMQAREPDGGWHSWQVLQVWPRSWRFHPTWP